MLQPPYDLVDTSKFLPIPKDAAIKVLTRAKQADGLEELNANLEREILLWRLRVNDKDSLVRSYMISDSTHKAVALKDSLSMVKLEEKFTNCATEKDRVKAAGDKALRRAKNGTKWTAAGGIIGIILVGVLSR